MNRIICPHAASGCYYPAGECAGLCMSHVNRECHEPLDDDGGLMVSLTGAIALFVISALFGLTLGVLAGFF